MIIRKVHRRVIVTTILLAQGHRGSRAPAPATSVPATPARVVTSAPAAPVAAAPAPAPPAPAPVTTRTS